MNVKNLIATEPAWLERLVTDYKITVVRDGDLASLKYNQLESPMHEPIVQECRGMVVHVPTGQILAHPYNKFWNHGEALADPIDWSTASVLEKLDGSLMVLYWQETPEWAGWRVASSGTPSASGSFGATDRTFRDAFWEHWQALGMLLPPATLRGVTFMFELCDAPNRVVVRHERPRIVLHGARSLDGGREWTHAALAGVARAHGWEHVRAFPIATITDCLAASEALDPLETEGFVVVDATFNRVKIKSPRYVILHHMKGEATPRRAIELWQTGEAGELLAHFPEMAPQILPVHALLDEVAQRVVDDLVANANAPTRKDFAAVIKAQPWAATCFRMYGDPAPTVEKAKELMRAQTLASLERIVERGI